MAIRMVKIDEAPKAMPRGIGFGRVKTPATIMIEEAIRMLVEVGDAAILDAKDLEVPAEGTIEPEIRKRKMVTMRSRAISVAKYLGFEKGEVSTYWSEGGESLVIYLKK